MKILKHIITAGGMLFIFLVVPALIFVNFNTILGSVGYDTVSGATRIIEDKPSGRFVILLNREKYSKSGSLDLWTDFFNDADIPVIMEDIACMVIDGDESALELAKTYQSRLPENQMTIQKNEGLMVVSKAEYSMFDVIIMSEEYAGAYSAATVYKNTAVIEKVNEGLGYEKS